MRFSEYGGHSEFNETGRTSREDIGLEMRSQAEEINRLIASINLEDEADEINRDAVYGIDQETVRKEEKQEFKLSSPPQSNDSTTVESKRHSDMDSIIDDYINNYLNTHDLSDDNSKQI